MAKDRENHHTLRNILIGTGIGLGAAYAVSRIRDNRRGGRDTDEYEYDDDVVYDYWDR